MLEAHLTALKQLVGQAHTRKFSIEFNEITGVRRCRENVGGPVGSQSHQVSAMAANLATSAGFSDDTVVPPPDLGGPLGRDGGSGVGVGAEEEAAEAQRRHWESRAPGGE
jgi:hypothetical protein